MLKNIIFDLGNVLVDVDYTGFKNVIESQGVEEKQYLDFFASDSYRKLGYEAGLISTEEFTRRCINDLGLKMSDAEFADAFNNMFSEIKPMSELVRNLEAENKYKLYLLSNTSPLHFDYIKDWFDYINLLDDFALSYELKSLKPEKEIYERAMEKLNVNPAECIFIDDLAENCHGAEAAGIKAIQYDMNSHNKFEDEFNRILGLKK